MSALYRADDRHLLTSMLAGEGVHIDPAVMPSDANIASLARESRGSALLRGAMHNSHHLGQIITMRRLMSLWPPPGGTITW